MVEAKQQKMTMTIVALSVFQELMNLDIVRAVVIWV
jgi:hypothetical protein